MGIVVPLPEVSLPRQDGVDLLRLLFQVLLGDLPDVPGLRRGWNDASRRDRVHSPIEGRWKHANQDQEGNFVFSFSLGQSITNLDRYRGNEKNLTTLDPEQYEIAETPQGWCKIAQK